MYHIPSQKKSYKEKQNFDKFQLPTIEGVIKRTVYSGHLSDGIRDNLIENYNLYDGVVSEEAIEKAINPYGIHGLLKPAKIQHYPASAPRIDLLVGEELRRKFEFFVSVVNPTAISRKMQNLKDEYFYRLMQLITSGKTEEQIAAEVKNINYWAKYEYRDYIELGATQLLNYLYKQHDIKKILNGAFRDLLIGGIEIATVDIYGDTIFPRKCVPTNIWAVLSGDSNQLDDAEMIVEILYYSPGKLIDFYYNDLSNEEREYLENPSDDGLVNSDYSYFPFRTPDIGEDGIIRMADDFGTELTTYIDGVGAPFDSEGNIRLIKVTWASWRKIGLWTHYDPETGLEIKDWVDENFVPNKQIGETVEWTWIKEYWGADKIGKDIYKNIGPKKVQFRDPINPSLCKSGYVGNIATINNIRVKSLMDRMKPFEYLYDVFLHRTELGFAKSWGKLGVIDISKKPDFLDFDQWLYYMQTMGMVVEDSFKSSDEGTAVGKLAGHMQPPRNTIDMDNYSFIQQNISFLQYIEEILSTISGVTRQRMGQIDTRETVGGVERAVMQSSHQTELWFTAHNNFKIRYLNLLFETTRIIYRDKEDFLQSFMDDASIQMFKISGQELMSAKFGVFCTDGTENMELWQTLKQISQTALQNDKIQLSHFISMYRGRSITEMERKLEAYEEEKRRMDEEKMQQQMEMQQQQQQMQLQLMQMQMENENNQKELDRQNKLQVEQMKIEGKILDKDIDNDGIEDNIEKEKMQLELDFKREELSTKENLELTKLQVQERMNKENNLVKERIANKKPTKKL